MMSLIKGLCVRCHLEELRKFFVDCVRLVWLVGWEVIGYCGVMYA